MPDNHILVEQQLVNWEMSVMEPQPLHEVPGAIPMSFTLENGTWQPYEFVYPSIHAVDKLQELLSKPEFLQKMASLLEQHGLDDMFSLHLEVRNHIHGKFGTLEQPGQHEHELIITAQHSDDGNSSSDIRQVM